MLVKEKRLCKFGLFVFYRFKFYQTAVNNKICNTEDESIDKLKQVKILNNKSKLNQQD